MSLYRTRDGGAYFTRMGRRGPAEVYGRDSSGRTERVLVFFDLYTAEREAEALAERYDDEHPAEVEA